MRKNRFKEDIMVRVNGGTGPYFICRDQDGMAVLREMTEDGKEIFSPILDDGTKNKGKARVVSANLLYAVIAQKGGCAFLTPG